jgi:hypothetical protein
MSITVLTSSQKWYLLKRATLKMEAVSASDTLIPTYETTHCHDPQDRNMNVQCRENLEYYAENGRSKETNSGANCRKRNVINENEINF